MEINYIDFDINIGRSKPENIVHKDEPCPFCRLKKVEKILDRDGDILLIPNKYQVIKEATQLLIIEADKCDVDISTYKLDHLEKLLSFAFRYWLEMEKSEKYGTVLFFKNHGPLSGGTMRHPHMQIVGLKEKLALDSYFSEENFQGEIIFKENGNEINLSTKPKVGFYEFNIILKSKDEITFGAENLQNIVDYILNHHRGKTSSYNIFFYHKNKKIYIKVIPRYPTSPLFLGYNISLIPSDFSFVARGFKKLYNIE